MKPVYGNRIVNHDRNATQCVAMAGVGIFDTTICIPRKKNALNATTVAATNKRDGL